jgi:Putative zinc-finger
MKNETCKNIRPLLVDYSDGALPADETRQIAAHLAHCPDCREELGLLEHSLALAQEIWNETVTIEPTPEILPSPFGRGAGGEGDGISVTTPLTLALSQRERGRKFRRSLAWISGAAAISAVVIVLLFGQTIFSIFKASGIKSQPIEIAKNNSNQNTSARPNSASAGGEIDVMQYIAREERSARLAASVQILAGQPGLEQYKENAERYLKEHYADTAAVRMLEKQQTPPQ